MWRRQRKRRHWSSRRFVVVYLGISRAIIPSRSIAAAAQRATFSVAGSPASLESIRDRSACKLLDIVHQFIGGGCRLSLIADRYGANHRDMMLGGSREIARPSVMQVIEPPRHGVARHDGTRDERIARALCQEVL